MRFKSKKLLLVLSLMLMQAATSAEPNITPQDKQPFDYEKALGWITELNNPYNICNGYYRSYPVPYVANSLIDSQKNNYNIVADHVLYSVKGTSILRGHVRVTQPNKEFKTGLAYLYRNKKTGKIENAYFYHGVRLFTPGELLVARYGHLNLPTNTVHLYNTAYRNLANKANAPVQVVNPVTKQVENRSYGLNYWGHAKQINQTKPHVYVLKHATYTTCPPTKECVWHLHASTVNLNNDTGVGDAWNSVLWVKGVPVFWTPYINFPLNKKRKTGFLLPTYGTTSNSGFKFALPFYWNIAPNYDATITGTYLSDRGVMFTPLFRYLTHTSTGKVRFSFLPDDKEFAKFKKSAQTNPKYANKPDELKTLRKDSDNRYAFYYDNVTNFNQHWSANVDYNRVSDGYVISDLGSSLVNNSNNQLLQKGQIQYQGINWDFFGLLQDYQTLHQVNQTPVSNQYARLPELQLGASYPDFYQGLNFSFSTDAVNFFKSKNPDTRLKPVIGDRFSFRPSVDYPLLRPYGYLTPRLQLQMTDYQLHQEGNIPASSGVILPIVDVHGGLYFFRDFTWFKTPFEETLEPELYYLYVPYHNQDQFPIFDTSTEPFNYNYMFQDNRFTGIDRIGDANQVTYALTTRFINEETGLEKGSISIGQIMYFENRRVILCSGHNCTARKKVNTLDKKPFSPIASQATYNFTTSWSATADLTWNPYVDQFSYENATLHYNDKQRHILNMGYSYVKSGGAISGEPTNDSNVTKLRQLNLSGEWLIKRHWDLLGEWQHSWSGNDTVDQANAYLAGLEYDSCCWAVRFVAARTFQGVNEQKKNQFNDAFYVQVDLKGLGSVGNDDPSTLLASSISGYKDSFDQAVIG